MHSTHLSVDYMKALARERFFWPGLQEDLHNLYKTCQACRRESASKPNTRKYNTVPRDLLELAPAEEISTDFMSYGAQDVLVIKDRATGYIAAKLCKDKTTKSAIEGLKLFFFAYGFANCIRSDGGPCFKDAFSQELDKLGVKHTLSSAYNPQSNGGAERVCKSIREVLNKRGGHRTTQVELSELCFKVNSHIQPGGKGSAHERFHRRSPKTLLPGSMQSVVEHQEMIKKRHDNQVNIAKKKGRSSTEEFIVKDRVVIQDNTDGKWKEIGTIISERKADDLSVQSYEIKMDNGTTKIRNKKFIRHFTKEDDQADRHVQFHSPTHGNRSQEAGSEKAVQRGADSREQTASPPRTRSKARAQ